MLRTLKKWIIALRTQGDPILTSTANPKDLDLIDLQRAANVAWAHNRQEASLAYLRELSERDPRKDWSCLRCEHTEFVQGSARVAGSTIAAWIEVESNTFHTLTCRRCGFTGFYKVLSSAAAQGMDLLT